MTGSGREWGTGLAVVDRIESGDERERAAHASKTVIRPLDARGGDGTR